MKAICIIALLSIFCHQSFGQSLDRQVIGATGHSGGNANLQIDYTVGEAVVATLETNDLILTQGFHQSSVTVVGIADGPAINWAVNHYPNPATHTLNLNIEGDFTADLRLQVVNVSGQQVYSAEVQKDGNNLQHAIPVERWSAGQYFLSIYAEGSPPHTLIFQKIN